MQIGYGYDAGSAPVGLILKLLNQASQTGDLFTADSGLDVDDLNHQIKHAELCLVQPFVVPVHMGPFEVDGPHLYCGERRGMPSKGYSLRRSH